MFPYTPDHPVTVSEDITTSYEQISAAYDKLQQVYEQEIAAHQDLQRRFDELEIMVKYQRKMVNQVKELYGEQVQQAITDPITGLPNHRAVITRIEEEIMRCEGQQNSFAILFMDIDHFKQVNDTWGHRAGDALLHEVASRLRAALRQNDFVGRYGGEEFVVVLTEVGRDEAMQTAERLRFCISEQACTWEVEDTQTIVQIPITTSIGVAVYRCHGMTRSTLITSADHAMYRAKRHGRNCVYQATALKIDSAMNAGSA